MPGGHWSQKEKYVSEDLNKVHHANSRDLNSKNVGVSLSLGVKTGSKNMYVGLAGKCLDPLYPDVSLAVKPNQFNSYCTDKKNDANESIKSVSQTAQLSRKEKFKMAIKDYGIVILVFHIGVSLISLGCCYVAIARLASHFCISFFYF